MIIVSRNGIHPSGLASSDVNWMCGSKLLMCFKNFSFLAESKITQASSTYPLPHPWRAFGSVDGLYLKVLHEEVGHYGADGRPHGCSLNLFIEPVLKLKIGVFKQNSSRLMICSTFMVVLEWSSQSSSNLLLMMLMAGSMGTDVNSAETSYKVIHSFAWRVIPFICSIKSPVFLMWWGTHFPTHLMKPG